MAKLPIKSSKSSDDLEQLMKQLIIQERLRQARLSFNMALSLTVLSTVLSLAGVGLLLSGNMSEGAATTLSGLGVGTGLLSLTQTTNNRLDNLAKEFYEED